MDNVCFDAVIWLVRIWCNLYCVTDSLISKGAFYNILERERGEGGGGGGGGLRSGICVWNKLYCWSQVPCLLCRCSEDCFAVTDPGQPLSLQA